MKIETLDLENFLIIKIAHVELADRGLVLVQGVNDDDSSADSNGSGKSSLADGLCWVGFGTTARGGAGDEVVNELAGKDCHGALQVLDGDTRFRIDRYRKHHTHKNQLRACSWPVSDPSKVTDLTLGTDKLTQAVVDRIIGCPYEVFRAAVYAGQEAMPDLPGMTDKPLKLLIEEAAGVTVLERAHEVARSEALAAQKARAAAATGVDLITRRIVDADDRVASALAAVEDEKRTKADRLRNLTDKAKADKAGIETDQAKNPDLAAEKIRISAALDAAETAIAAVAGERAKERELIARESEAVAVESSVTTSLRTIKRDAESQSAKVTAFGSRVGTPCDECGKPYCEHDIEAARAAAVVKFHEIKKRFDAQKITVEDARKLAQIARETLAAHRASMTDVSETTALAGRLRSTLDRIRSFETSIANRLNTLRADILRISEEKDRPLIAGAAVERAKAHRATLDAEKIKAEELVVTAQTELELAEAAVKVFGPGGVRAHILDTVTPFLNSRTAHYLATLSDGNISANWTTLVRTAKGELREKFSIDVANDHGGKSFKMQSGGEKRKVRLACALSLQDLVASRATKPIELFIGDEIDDALDPAGMERLMVVLEEKARDRGTVVVISHNNLKDWARQSIIVRKSGGVATMMAA